MIIKPLLRMNKLPLFSKANFFRSYKTSNVRVRFAPSPTGFLHLGGLRTALYNYLFALAHGGKMILRIEDTDQSRKVEGAQKALEESLKWTGVDYHEGPNISGNFGPYVQSERCHIYSEHVDILLQKGSAYHCFCTERRLDLLRREALRSRQVPKYDNRCRHLTKQEIKEKMDKGVPHCIRFKLSGDCKVYDDLVYGPVAYDVASTEGDPVIFKSDGFPTYHLASVVDDHHMKVSHVMRGVEWQISTTKHILLYRAFGWEPPHFAHLPLIMNPDGSKLSKRQGDIRVQDYKEKGIFPAALVNYITLAGGGFARNQGEGISAATMEELASQFQLERVNSHSSRLNPELLVECNRLEIMEHLKDEKKTGELVTRSQQLIQSTLGDKSNLKTSKEYVKSVLLWSSGRLTSLNDLVQPSLAFLWVLPNQNLRLDSCDLDVLKMLLSRLQNDRFSFDSAPVLKCSLKEFSGESGVKFNVLMKTMRTVLSGLDEGPGVAEMMNVLGKKATIDRINTVINA